MPMVTTDIPVMRRLRTQNERMQRVGREQQREPEVVGTRLGDDRRQLEDELDPEAQEEEPGRLELETAPSA